MNRTRRNLLGHGAALGACLSPALPLALNLLGLSSASAQSTSGYKAIVCIFMGGGNDGYNMLLPTDQPSFDEYSRLRTDETGLKLADLLAITPKTARPGRSFALHPSMGAAKQLFEAGSLSFIANTGSLVAPITASDWAKGKAIMPASMWSHTQGYVQQLSSATAFEPFGWGGRLADMLKSMNSNTAFTCMSPTGNATFLTGRTIFQLRFTGQGLVPIAGLKSPLFGSAANSAVVEKLVNKGATSNLSNDYAAVVKRSRDAQAAISTAMAPAGLGGVANPLNPKNGLAASLQAVARIIAGHAALGVSRQFFYVQMGGFFDTHYSQAENQLANMANLAEGLQYFDGALGALGLRDSVVTFTASDFGRTLTTNGNGTDHGWGSHHIVMSGANTLVGNDIIGRFPEIGLQRDRDAGMGRLIPEIGTSQIAGTLGRWMGATDTQLDEVLPDLKNFGTDRFVPFLKSA